MNIKENIIGIVAVLAFIGVLFLGFNQPGGQTVVQQAASNTFGSIPAVNAPSANTVLPNGQLTPNPSNFDYLVARLYFYIDGAFGMGNGTSVPTNIQVVRSALTSGTSTPCQLKNPFTATSTITGFAFNITTATGTAIYYDVGTSTSKYATTTTMLSSQYVASGLQSILTWEGGANNTVISSGQYIVVGTEAPTAGTAFTNGVVIAGSCQATFQTVN